MFANFNFNPASCIDQKNEQKFLEEILDKWGKLDIKNPKEIYWTVPMANNGANWLINKNSPIIGPEAFLKTAPLTRENGGVDDGTNYAIMSQDKENKKFLEEIGTKYRNKYNISEQNLDNLSTFLMNEFEQLNRNELDGILLDKHYIPILGRQTATNRFLLDPRFVVLSCTWNIALNDYFVIQIINRSISNPFYKSYTLDPDLTCLICLGDDVPNHFLITTEDDIFSTIKKHNVTDSNRWFFKEIISDNKYLYSNDLDNLKTSKAITTVDSSINLDELEFKFNFTYDKLTSGMITARELCLLNLSKVNFIIIIKNNKLIPYIFCTKLNENTFRNNILTRIGDRTTMDYSFYIINLKEIQDHKTEKYKIEY